MNRTIRKLVLLVLAIFAVHNSYAQSSVWQKTTLTNQKNNFQPDKKHYYQLNQSVIQQILLDDVGLKIDFPTGKSSFTEFKLRKTQVMHPLLAKKYPDIQTYEGVATDDSNHKIRFTYSKRFGVNGVILKSDNTKFEVRPINSSIHTFKESNNDSNSDLNNFECATKDNLTKFANTNEASFKDINDGYIRKYRLALSTTGEYAQHFLDGSEANDTDRRTKILNAMVASINRINGIFEKDLSIVLELIANTDELIYLDSANDPFTSPSLLGNQLQTILDAHPNIGSDAYDVGHLYSKSETATSGNAGCIACVCRDGFKGSAYTLHLAPDTDNMNLIAAHELGHQFGAYHTQSSSTCRSGENSEVEPGSGSTLMSYAGICSPNVQDTPDDYYNYTSIRDIAIWTIDNSACAELIPTGNTAPIVKIGTDYVIPASTPFILEAQASDSDGDVLTYCWEQADPEDPFTNSEPSSTSVFGPLFRSFPPTESNMRYFPKLKTVIDNLSNVWEVLPSVSRKLNFSVTVRDNAPNGGQIVADLIELDVVDAAGPFVVTSQNDTSAVWSVGKDATINWNVANTNIAPISTDNVQILLSTDGGNTFDVKLVDSTPNTGTYNFVVPNINSTSQARIMIKAIHNIYYAVNSTNFTIQASDFVFSTETPKAELCDANQMTYTINYKTLTGFNEEVNLSIQNLPAGISADLSKLVFTGQTNEDFTVTLTTDSSLKPDNYSFNLVGLSKNGVENKINLKLNVYQLFENSSTLITPANNSVGLDPKLKFEWSFDTNATSYLIEIASDINFTTIIECVDVINNEFNTVLPKYNQNYFWRIKNINNCSRSEFSEINTFSTKCVDPSNIFVTDIGIDFISIVWEGENTSWSIEYGLKGFTQGYGTTINTSTNDITIEGLNSQTEYSFYITGECSVGISSNSTEPNNITTALNLCNDTVFYDSGNEDDNYSNNENNTIVIAPESDNDRIKVSFKNFETERNYDFLSVYDGPNDRQPSLGKFSGTISDLVLTSSHPSGSLTFVFTSDSSITRAGWEADVVCELKPNCDMPVDFKVADITSKQVSLSWGQTTNNTGWTLEYGIKDFDLGSGTEIIENATTTVITNLDQNTAYDVYIKSNCTLGDYSDVIGPLSFTTLISCATPINIIATNVGKSEVMLDLGTIDNAVNWEVEYGVSGFEQGNGTTIETPISSLTIRNLENSTVYDVYVRAFCDSDQYSNWSAVYSFQTVADFCNGAHFYDTGGIDNNYASNESMSTVINPENIGDRVRVVFNSFETEAGFDFLSVYDGPDNSVKLLGKFDGKIDTLSFVSSHPSGSLTFVFISDSLVNRPGWDATVVCEPIIDCSPTETNLISNGSFECGMTDWSNLGTNDEDCFTTYKSLENSGTLCSDLVDKILPTDGYRAAFAAINTNGHSQEKTGISQSVTLPNNLNTYSQITLKYDFKVNFNYTMSFNIFKNRKVITSFLDKDLNEIYSTESLSFGSSPSSANLTETVTTDDALDYLLNYSGQEIYISISVTSGTASGPTVAMIDNVSLTLDKSLSITDNEVFEKNVNLYPNPSNGYFSILNTTSTKLSSIEIFNLNGVLIKTMASGQSSETKVALKNVASGNYFVKVSNDKSSAIKQIIID